MLYFGFKKRIKVVSVEELREVETKEVLGVNIDYTKD
jgi:hypothetical protein